MSNANTFVNARTHYTPINSYGMCSICVTQCRLVRRVCFLSQPIPSRCPCFRPTSSSSDLPSQNSFSLRWLPNWLDTTQCYESPGLSGLRVVACRGICTATETLFLLAMCLWRLPCIWCLLKINDASRHQPSPEWSDVPPVYWLSITSEEVCHISRHVIISLAIN
jgi:hypothetical protein